MNPDDKAQILPARPSASGLAVEPTRQRARLVTVSTRPRAKRLLADATQALQNELSRILMAQQADQPGQAPDGRRIRALTALADAAVKVSREDREHGDEEVVDLTDEELAEKAKAALRALGAGREDP